MPTFHWIAEYQPEIFLFISRMSGDGRHVNDIALDDKANAKFALID